MADEMSMVERARKDAHEAPLNKVFTDHLGRKFLGSHSTAWADASRRYAEAVHAAISEAP